MTTSHSSNIRAIIQSADANGITLELKRWVPPAGNLENIYQPIAFCGGSYGDTGIQPLTIGIPNGNTHLSDNGIDLCETNHLLNMEHHGFTDVGASRQPLVRINNSDILALPSDFTSVTGSQFGTKFDWISGYAAYPIFLWLTKRDSGGSLENIQVANARFWASTSDPTEALTKFKVYAFSNYIYDYAIFDGYNTHFGLSTFIAGDQDEYEEEGLSPSNKLVLHTELFQYETHYMSGLFISVINTGDIQAGEESEEVYLNFSCSVS